VFDKRSRQCLEVHHAAITDGEDCLARHPATLIMYVGACQVAAAAARESSLLRSAVSEAVSSLNTISKRSKASVGTSELTRVILPDGAPISSW